MPNLILCFHTSFELLFFPFLFLGNKAWSQHRNLFLPSSVYLINKTNNCPIPSTHTTPAFPDYLWLLCAVLFVVIVVVALYCGVVFIATEMRLKISVLTCPLFLSSFPPCYVSSSCSEISLICFQDWPTASTSTKTAGPTLSTALVQSSTKKCKTWCICCQWLFGYSNDWQYTDNTMCCLAAAHHPNEASGNQLFPKFPSWR